MLKSGEFKFKVIPFSLVASFSTSCNGADDICIPLCASTVMLLCTNLVPSFYKCLWGTKEGWIGRY